MSDFLSDVWDFFSDLISDVYSVLENIVETIWQEVVAPVIEIFFNLLGFEDETIVNGFVVTNQIYRDPWQKPWKQAVMSFVQNGTTMSDEIKAIYLTGNHVRIRAYMSYGENFYHYGLPTSGFTLMFPQPANVEAIIEAEEGYQIKVRKVEQTGATTEHWCRYWLQENEATHGYTWTAGVDELRDETIKRNYYIEAFSFDVGANAFDIDVSWLPNNGGTVSTAINDMPTVTATYEWQQEVFTAHHELITPTSTYNADDTGNPIFVTIDTATLADDPVFDGAGGVIVDTAENTGAPTVDAFDPIPQGYTYLTFQDVIPAPPLGRAYEVSYQPTSDLSVESIRYWTYFLYSGDTTYPQLYTTVPPIVGPDVDKFVPVVPLNLVQAWQYDLASPNAAKDTSRIILKKLQLKMGEITRGLKQAELGQGNSIRDCFLILGLNVAKQNSQVAIAYMYDYFQALLAGSPDNYAEWQLWKGYEDILKDPDASTTSHVNTLNTVWPGWETEMAHYWHLDNNSYFYSPVTWYQELVDWRLECLAEVRGHMADLKIKASIVEDRYNFNLSIGAVQQRTVTGVIGPQGTYQKVIGNVTNTKLILRRQTTPTQYDEVELHELSAFTVLKSTGNNTAISRLDFVGSDNGGANVKNNMVIPMSYGVLQTRGVLDTKRLVYEAVHTVIHMQNVTELRYYETEAFLSFLDGVIKIVAVVILFYSAGSASGAAEFLWALAANIAYGVAIEYVLTKIILNNPNNKAAIAVATILAVVAAAYTGQGVETAIDAALLAVNALSQVTSIYVDIKSDILADEQAEFLKVSAEKQEELEAAYEELGDNTDMLNFIKQLVITRVEPPDDFYARTLNTNLSEEMLELANKLDIQNIYGRPVVVENTYEG